MRLLAALVALTAMTAEASAQLKNDIQGWAIGADAVATLAKCNELAKPHRCSTVNTTFIETNSPNVPVAFAVTRNLKPNLVHSLERSFNYLGDPKALVASIEEQYSVTGPKPNNRDFLVWERPDGLNVMLTGVIRPVGNGMYRLVLVLPKLVAEDKAAYQAPVIPPPKF